MYCVLMRWLLICRMVVQQFPQMQANSQKQEWTRHLLATQVTGAQINISIHALHCRHIIPVIPWTWHRVWMCRVCAAISRSDDVQENQSVVYVVISSHLCVYRYIINCLSANSVTLATSCSLLYATHNRSVCHVMSPLQHILFPAPCAYYCSVFAHNFIF